MNVDGEKMTKSTDRVTKQNIVYTMKVNIAHR